MKLYGLRLPRLGRLAASWAARERGAEKRRAHLLVSIRTDASGFVVFVAVLVGRIVEGTVALTERSTTALVGKMPVETREGLVLGALVLLKQGTLLTAKLLQIAGKGEKETRQGSLVTKTRSSARGRSSSSVRRHLFGAHLSTSILGARRRKSLPQSESDDRALVVGKKQVSRTARDHVTVRTELYIEGRPYKVQADAGLLVPDNTRVRSQKWRQVEHVVGSSWECARKQ